MVFLFKNPRAKSNVYSVVGCTKICGFLVSLTSVWIANLNNHSQTYTHETIYFQTRISKLFGREIHMWYLNEFDIHYISSRCLSIVPPMVVQKFGPVRSVIHRLNILVKKVEIKNMSVNMCKKCIRSYENSI